MGTGSTIRTEEPGLGGASLNDALHLDAIAVQIGAVGLFTHVS